jgi:hypothetical protein
MRQLARIAATLACLAGVTLIAAAPASADSIVYLDDGNVWLTSPDRAKQYQVTFDGGWDAPSQADDGTIVAAKGQMLVRMDRSGRVIGAPIRALGGASGTIPGETFKLFGPFDPEVSPDGKRIAYWATAYNPSSTGEIVWTDWRDVSLVTPSDRFHMPRANWITSVKSPSWIGNDRLLVAGSGLTNYNFETWQPGIGDDYLQWWFRYVYAIEADHELSRDGRKLVSVAQTNGLSSPANTLHYFYVPGPASTAGPYPETWKEDAPRPPAGEPRCENVRDSSVRNPTWAPSGSAVAYEDGDGIWVQQVPDLAATTCAGMSETLLLPGAKHADWGPADVVLSQKPGGASPAPAPGAGPGGTHASPLRAAVVPRQATRRRGLSVRLSLSRPARVTIEVCRRVGARCVGRVVRKVVRARAGTSRTLVPLRHVAEGRYTVRIAPAGGAAVTRPVLVR